MPYTSGVDVGYSQSLVPDSGYTKEIEVTKKLKARVLSLITQRGYGR